MRTTKRKEITLTFVLEAEDDESFPRPDQFAQGIYDGLPQEWYDYDTPGDEYAIVNIMTEEQR